VSVSGLGTLTNRVASLSAPNPTLERYQAISSHFPLVNTAKFPNLKGLTTVNQKPMYYKASGKVDGPPVVFVHGLGATSEYFKPLISALGLDQKYRIHLYDFEGHGLSPTHPLSTLSVRSLAADLNGIFGHADIPTDAILIADSMGGFIALQFVLSHPGRISRLILLSPPPSPLPEALGKRLYERAESARRYGMSAIVDSASLSTEPDSLTMLKPLALAARRISLLGQDPEGYAKACMAFGRATKRLESDDAIASDVDCSAKGKGTETKVLAVGESRPEESKFDLKSVYGDALGDGEWTRSLDVGGHWSVFQDLEGLVKVLEGVLYGS
jgi:pimeloyl-ACP methyl ester carboxylesterase